MYSGDRYIHGDLEDERSSCAPLPYRITAVGGAHILHSGRAFCRRAGGHYLCGGDHGAFYFCHHDAERDEGRSKSGKTVAEPAKCVGPAFLSAVLLGELIYVVTQSSAKKIDAVMISPKQVGLSLFGTYLLGVELASILLLSRARGAYWLGRREESENKSGVVTHEHLFRGIRPTCIRDHFCARVDRGHCKT